MTDKQMQTGSQEQIIIDGVEVQNCLFIGTNGLSNHKIPYCREFTNNCKDNPNCYFKQLAHKTQECEKRGEIISDLIGCVGLWGKFTEEEAKLAKDSSIADLIILLREKQKECEEQENKIKKLRKNLALEIESNIRYRKALEEIETVTKINCEEICGRKFADCNDTSCLSAELLDIINKAKGEGNDT